MVDPTEELEPLFDYSRVQPFDLVCLDDDYSDSSPAFAPKRRKTSDSNIGKEDKIGKVIEIVNCEDKEEDWLPPPPPLVLSDAAKLAVDSTIKELRLKKQELLSCAQSAEDMLRSVQESVKSDLSTSIQFSLESVSEKTSKPPCERAKIVISIQDKDELKQFRVYMDDKFERLFKMYADKVKLNLQSLIFSFDGDKISPTATPNGLGMEDNDIIEVHVKSS